MTVTMKEVAKAAGFNRATVSMVLNNHPTASKFTPETRLKIRETVEKLGYQPNIAARSLVMRKTNNIGIVISEQVQGQWENPYYASFLNGVNQFCSQNNFNVLTFCCKMDNVAEFVFPHGISRGNIGGLLLCGELRPETVKRFERLNLPYARIGTAVEESEHGAKTIFSPDIVQGLMQAAEYLVRNGHKRIARMTTENSSSRLIGERFDKAVSKSHLKVDVRHVYTSYRKCDAESAKNFMTQYLNIPERLRPSALITTPQACLGMLKEMKRYNMTCPEDLSLISSYDYEIFDYITPGITSLSYDSKALASHAAEKIIERINAPNNISGPVESKNDFPVSLNIRSSCRKLKYQ